MAISFVGSSSGTGSNGGNASCGLNGTISGLQAGDFVIAAFAIGTTVDADMASGLISSSNPGRWTLIGERYTSDTEPANLGVFATFLDSPLDGSIAMTGTAGAADSTAGVVMAFRGVDRTRPFDAAPVITGGVNTSNMDPAQIVLSGLSGVWTVVIGEAGHATAPSTLTNPTNYTTNAVSAEGSDTNDCIIGMGYNSSPSGTENPGAFTHSDDSVNNGWAAMTLALRPATAPGTIQFVGQVSGDNTNGSDVTLNLPSLQADDLVVVAGQIPRNADVDMAMTTSGYTEVADIAETADGVDTNLGVFYKKMGSTPDTTAVFNGGADLSDGPSAVALIFRGVDTTTPMDVTATTATGVNGGNADPPSINQADANAVILCAGSTGHVAHPAKYVLPQGYFGLSHSGGDTRDGTVGLAYQEGALAGDPADPSAFLREGRVADVTNSWAAVTMALRPAPTSTDLVIQDASHAHTADNVQPMSTSLVIQDATHAHAADNLYIGPAVHYVDGFDHQALSGNQFAVGSTGLYDGISAGASILATGGRNGGSCLQISPSNAVCRVFKLLPGTDTAVVVSSFYIKFTSFPTTDSCVGGIGVAGGVQARLLYNAATGKLNASFLASVTSDVGPVLDLNRWYLVDMRADVTTNPRKFDVSVDGSATVHVESATAGSVCDAYVFGNDTGSETYTAQYDDLVASQTSSDFPIGPHHTVWHLPTGDGTHNAGTNVMEREDGTDIGVDTAWERLDQVPANTTLYVKQSATGTGNYAEVTFTDTTETSIWGVEAYAALFSSDVTANSGTTRVVDGSGNTVVDVYAGDMSETALHYKTALVPAPATSGWMSTAFNALKMRVGFSGNVASIPRWAGVALQVVAQGPGADLTIHKARHGHTADNVVLEEVAGGATLVIQDATHAHAADNVALIVNLAIQDASHAHAADNLALTQVHNLAVQDAAHAHAADNLALTQVHNLAVQDASHTQTADNLGLTQVHNLAIADALHGHAADNLALTQVHNLTVQDAAHGHTADNIALTQAHNLAVADALHGHAADNVVLTEGALTLIIADALHAHTADNVQPMSTSLVIADATHAHAADNVPITKNSDLVIQEASHGHSADNVVITQVHQLVVQDSTHAHRTDDWSAMVDFSGGGTVTYGDGTVLVTTSGTGDFWGTADTGTFVHRPLVGKVEVNVVTAAAGNHRRLVLLRKSAAANSAFFGVILDGDSSHITTIWRDTDGAVADWGNENSGTTFSGFPVRVRIVYDGTTATAAVSFNAGSSWTQIGSRAVAGLTLQAIVSGGGISGQGTRTFDNILDLTQAHTLVIQDATHAHSADNVALTQEHYLVVQDAAHAHAADNVVLAVGGLQGFYPMEESASPLVPTVGTIQLTLSGSAPTYQVAGISGYGIQFNNASRFTAPAATDYAFSDVTIEAWIKTTDLTTDYNGVVVKQNAWGMFVGKAGDASQNGILGVYDWTGGHTSSGYFVADGNWHHVAFTRSGTTGRIYVDGHERLAGSFTHNIGGQTIKLAVGEGSEAGSQYFNGVIDQVAIWNIALSAEEIAEHASEFSGQQTVRMRRRGVPIGTG